MKRSLRLILVLLTVTLLCTVFGAVGFSYAETSEEPPAETNPLPEEVQWDYTTPFVYDMTEKKVNLLTEFDTTLYRIETKNDAFTDAHKYLAWAYVYDIVTDERLAAYCMEWEILPYEIKLDTYEWTYDPEMSYDGTEKTVSLVLPYDIDPSWVTYEGNTATLAGEGYTATATFELPLNATNFTVGENNTATLAWGIKKGAPDMSGVTFTDKLFAYDGAMHSIAVEGTLPEGVSVTYSIDGATKSGIYGVVATFTVADEANYNTPAPMTAKLRISYPTYVYPADSEKPIVIIDRTDGFDPTVGLYVNMKTQNYVSGIRIDNDFLSVLAAYEINFRENGEYKTYDGEYVVKLLIPERYLESENLSVVHITDDGKAELVPASEVTRDGEYLVFGATEFSVYAIAEPGQPLVNIAPKDSSGATTALIVVLAALIVVSLIAFIIRRRKSGEDEPANDPTPEDPTEPEEENTTEPEAEEPTEEPAEEPAPVEVPEEEAPAPTEEEPAEEPTPEETAEPVEENTTEPEAEEPTEEPTEEPAPAEVPEEEAPAPAEEEPKIPVVGDEVVMVRYRSSFMSRLIQSDEDIQSYYSAIKNKLLSYKGVKARTSWNFESFNKTRVQCAKLNIKGKAILLYINLDTEQYNAGKYHFQNVADKPKFADVPMMLKVKSERGLKYAIELIEELMKQLEIPEGTTHNVDYRTPFETNEALAERGLVKMIVPKGSVIGDNSSVISVNVSEMFDKDDEE